MTLFVLTKAVTAPRFYVSAAWLCAVLLIGCSKTPPTEQLARLLTTDKAGQYLLYPAWVGESKASIATGFFAPSTNRPPLRSPGEKLYFDLLNVFDPQGTPVMEMLGSKVISQKHEQSGRGWSFSGAYAYRANFPTDVELGEARTISTLTNLLGPNGGGFCVLDDGTRMRSTASWSFFRLNEQASIETLSVFCFVVWTRGQTETAIKSMEVRRGYARPTRK